MASDACPKSNQRSENGRKVRGEHHFHNHVDLCVVCGDRCKCFFWRSVKQGQQYKCRYDQNCDINPNHRNACRYCRFQRCLSAGMQPESVRLQTNKTVKSESESSSSLKRQNVDSSVLETQAVLDSTNSMSDNDPDSPIYKKIKRENSELVNSILELEEKINQVADFSENEAPKRMLGIYDIVKSPEYLECYRTRVHFLVRLHRTSCEEMEFCKFRTFTKVLDFLNGFQALGLGQISVEDKIKLLRQCYAPLTIFDIIIGTLSATKDENLLCLPTGITLSRNEELVQNSFMSQKLVNNIINTLTRTIDGIDMTETEVCLLKAIILLNQEDHGLSDYTRNSIGRLRDRLHGTLYQFCVRTQTESSTIRFARLLHILPKLSLLAREMVEHIRVIYTFEPDKRNESNIFFDLFGDIFEEERESSNLSKSMCDRSTKCGTALFDS